MNDDYDEFGNYIGSEIESEDDQHIESSRFDSVEDAVYADSTGDDVVDADMEMDGISNFFMIVWNLQWFSSGHKKSNHFTRRQKVLSHGGRDLRAGCRSVGSGGRYSGSQRTHYCPCGFQKI